MGKRGHGGSPAVKVTDSWLACHEFDPRIAENRRAEGLINVKYVEAQTSSHWCGVIVRRGRLEIMRSVASSPHLAL
ncbi:hypothetical protein TNCV_415951 [Trichonephila clavipes]|nr:hypothetical protein TNCV_415951 [Trichonephila clavipes]